MSPSPLPGILTTLFGVLRVLSALSLVLGPLLWLVPKPAQEVTAQVDFASGVRPTLQEASASGVRVSARRSHIVIKAPAADAEVRVQRWFERASQTLLLAMGLVWCDLCYRLCRNVQEGEVFTERNFKRMRLLGYVTAGTGVIYSLLATWSNFRIVEYLHQHTTLPVESAFAPLSILHHMDLGDMILGLCVLLGAEIFRQGLVLKQESELTV